MKKLSTGVMHRCAKPVGLAQDYAPYLTGSVRSRLADEPVSRIARAQCMVLLAVLCIVGTTPATAAKDVKQTTSARPMKNRSSNNVLPPQIKASVQNINKTSEKQLLKEKSNRYTWEGRLADFCPLKKIDKKVLNKNLLMTYADFKRIQQEQQNKK